MNGIPALAQTVQSQGRGNDTQLVHMTPREVQGLQALAMANGGSLTLNPQTGLPEAGFLDNILPMIAGAALTIGSGGALSPLMAAGIVGGGTALVSGDIGKGFMAGLGAYGGGGLGQGLSAAGTAANAAPAAGASAATATPTAAPTLTNTQAALQSAGMNPAQIAAQTGTAAPTATAATTGVGAGTLPADMTAALKGGASYGASSAPTMGVNFQTAGEGFKSLAGPEGRAAFMSEAGVGGLGGLAKYGGAAAMPLLSSDAQGAPAGTDQMIRPYSFDIGLQDVAYRTGAPGEATSELQYFRPRYTARKPYRAKKGGGVPTLEEGGFVMTKKAVDGMGNGDNKKGQEELRKGLGAIALKGKGTGTSDSIKTTIANKVPARVSNGEAYVPKKGVKKAGGTTSMYALMRRAEKKAERKA